MNDKGVSVLVGFILLMMISMLFLSVVQTFEVPKVCEKIEANAMKDYISEFSKLASNLVTGSSFELQLTPVSYPNYLFLMTPPPASYSVVARNDNITISFEAVLPNGSTENVTLTVPSKRIVLTPGFYYYPKNELIYENTAVFRKIRENSYLPVVQQKMFSGNVNIVGIEGKDFSVSSSSPSTIPFTLESSGSVSVKKARITFSSVYPEYWTKFGGNVSGDKVSFNVSSTVIHFEIYSVGYSSKHNREGRVFMLESHTLSVTQGETLSLGILVTDKYFQPLPGVNVKVSVSSPAGKVSATALQTGYDGKAIVQFTGVAVGVCDVTFQTPYGNATYTITVKGVALPSGTGPFTVRWIDKTLLDSDYGNVWNATLEGYTKVLSVSVSYAGQPVKGVTVNFVSTNDSVVRLGSSSNTTDSNGITSTEAYAVNNGTATLIAYTAGSYDTLNLTLVGVPSNPLLRNWWNLGWKHRIPINITYTGTTTLTGYQIEVILNSSFDWNNVSSNAADIRFTDSNGNLLPYWIEYWDYGSKAVIWVNVSKIKPGTTTIYMYFDNPNANSASNGKATFVFFDNFSTWTGWHKLWLGNVVPYNFNGQTVLEKTDYDDPNGGYKNLGTTISNFRMLVEEYRPSTPTNTGPYDRYGLTDNSNNGYFITRLARPEWYQYYWWDEFGIERRDGKSATSLNYVYYPQNTNTWYITELTRYNGQFTATLYSSKVVKLTSVSASDNKYTTFTRFEVRGGHPYYIKWIAVAKYNPLVSKPTLGKEQTI